MTDNGKDVVDVPAQSLGLRVAKCITSETEEGTPKATITIVGWARNLAKFVGEQVNVITGGARGHHGLCSAVTIKAGKTERKKEVSLKVVGARELDQLVGLQVTVEQAEPGLVGAEPNVGDEDTDPRSLRPADHLDKFAVNPPRNKKRGKDASAGAD